MKPCETCEYRSTKKTKYETYDWCKAYGCATSSPKCECRKEKAMTTREVFNRMPEAVRNQLENIRKGYKNKALDTDATRAELYGYTLGLRDAGIISERERQILFVYGTV